MRKYLGDPLIHFLLIGAFLFALLTWRSDESDPRQIRLSATQVRTALQTSLTGLQSGMTQSELETLIEPLIRDEVFYREALALGLDTDDDQVRDRLIEKMRYVSEDLADPEPADVPQLREFFDADPARFMRPETVTFNHMFFSPRQRGDSVQQDAEAALEALRSGNASQAAGDSTPLGEEFLDATRDRLTILFGMELADHLFTADIGLWTGPHESEFGLHLARVTSRRAAERPRFADVEDRVREEFAADQRMRRNEEVFAELRERYEISVEWPEELSIAD